MSAIDEIIFRYHRLDEAYERAIAPYVNEAGDVMDLPGYDETKTDFAYDFTDLLHELVEALYASDHPPHPKSVLEATAEQLAELHEENQP